MRMKRPTIIHCYKAYETLQMHAENSYHVHTSLQIKQIIISQWQNLTILNHPYILLYNFRSTWCGCAVTQNTSQRENLFWYTARYKKAVRDMSTCPVTRMSRSIQPSFLATWGALEVSKNMFSAQTCISMIYADIYHRPRQTASSFQWM